MQPNYVSNNPECGRMQILLSDYIDNTLSGRQVWEVERHLAECRVCADQAHEMQATVQLLQAAPRYDTGDDFMAKLHARLDTVEPEQARSPLAGLRDWLGSLPSALNSRRAPALALGMAMAVLALLTFLPRPTPTNPVLPGPGTPPPALSVVTLQRNVALAALNPLDDPAAANLEAHTAMTEASAAPDPDNAAN